MKLCGVVMLWGLLVWAGQAWAEILTFEQVVGKNADTDVKGYQAMTWVVAIVFTLIVLALGFKNSKRTHLD